MSSNAENTWAGGNMPSSPQQIKFPTSNIAEIVIFMVDGIGDTILALPALRAITTLHRNKVILICSEAIRPYLWFLKDLEFKEIITIEVDFNDSLTPTFNDSDITQSILNCDLFFSFCGWNSELIMALLKKLNPSISAGFFRDFNINLGKHYFSEKAHAISAYLQFAELMQQGIKLEDYSYPPKLEDSSKEFVSTIKNKLLHSKKVFVIHAETKKNKMWQQPKLIKTINAFLNEHSDYIAVIVGIKDMQLDSGPQKNRIISFSGFSFEIACTLLSESDLFLGVDSCMLHLADLYRIPLVALFGPTSAIKYGGYYSKYINICGRKKKMENISVNNVVFSLRKVLR